MKKIENDTECMKLDCSNFSPSFIFIAIVILPDVLVQDARFFGLEQTTRKMFVLNL